MRFEPPDGRIPKQYSRREEELPVAFRGRAEELDRRPPFQGVELCREAQAASPGLSVALITTLGEEEAILPVSSVKERRASNLCGKLVEVHSLPPSAIYRGAQWSEAAYLF